MGDQTLTTVVDKDGLHGTFETVASPMRVANEYLRVRLEDGHEVMLPSDLLEERRDGTYYVPVGLRELEPATQAGQASSLVLPVIEEKLLVHRHRMRTGGLRVTKRIREQQQVVDEPGFAEEVRVEHVPVNRILDAPATMRHEGDTIIIPIMEEVLVVEKRLVLKEEVRITRERHEVRNPQPVTLRREEITIERTKHPGEDDKAGGSS